MARELKMEVFDNVWDAIEDTPEEAARMTILANLLLAVDRRVRSWSLPPAQAAKRLGVTQARLNDLLKGKIDKFGLDDLVALAVKAGLQIKLDVREAA